MKANPFIYRIIGSLALIVVLAFVVSTVVLVGRRVLLELPAREGGLEGGGAALVGRGVHAARSHLDPPPRQLAILLRRVEVLALNIMTARMLLSKNRAGHVIQESSK